MKDTKRDPLDRCNSDWAVFEIGQVTGACEDDMVMKEIEEIVSRFAEAERERERAGR